MNLHKKENMMGMRGNIPSEQREDFKKKNAKTDAIYDTSRTPKIYEQT